MINLMALFVVLMFFGVPLLIGTGAVIALDHVTERNTRKARQ